MTDNDPSSSVRQPDAGVPQQHPADLGVCELLFETFRGRNRWINAMAMLWTFVGLALAIFSAYRFFHAEDTRPMIAWATAFLFFSLWVAMLKMWFWMEMQKVPIVREIARLELQIADLSRRLDRYK